MQQQEVDVMDELLVRTEQVQQQEAEGMQETEVLPGGVEQGMLQQEVEGMEEEIQQQEAEGMMDEDEELTSDESENSSDWDELEELEELNPPLLQPPGQIVDDVRAYLPPLTMASLVAERPRLQFIPCDRRANWSSLPMEALNIIYDHLPLSDIHVMGSVFDDNLNAGWLQRWIEEDLVLHDSQIHFATYKDVKYYIRKHGGIVDSLRIDKLAFTSQNVRSWCRELRKPEVIGPREIVLVNRGSPSNPLCLEPVPKEILLPFNGRGLKKLHLCFFTLPRGGLHLYVALAGICELGLHGCAYSDDELADTITTWLNLQRFILSYASQTELRVVSNSLQELNLCNSSIRNLDVRRAVALIQLSNLDLDSTVIRIDHLHIRTLTILEVMINYTALPHHSQVFTLQVLLNSFPCVQELKIKRKDNMSEGQMLLGDKCPYILFADVECLTSHLKLLTFSDFRGGKWELALIKALGSKAKKLSVLKVVCHPSCLETTRAEVSVVLKEVFRMNLDLDVSIY